MRAGFLEIFSDYNGYFRPGGKQQELKHVHNPSFIEYLLHFVSLLAAYRSEESSKGFKTRSKLMSFKSSKEPGSLSTKRCSGGFQLKNSCPRFNAGSFSMTISN